MIRALRGYSYIAPTLPHPRDYSDRMVIDPQMLERMTEGRIDSSGRGGFEITPEDYQFHIGGTGHPSIKSEDISFGIGGRPAYSPPRTLNNDPMPLTPQQLEMMTSGRLPATNAAPAIQTPDEFMRHSVPRPSGERTQYLPPDPDRTSSQRLASLLMQHQSY